MFNKNHISNTRTLILMKNGNSVDGGVRLVR